MIESERSNIYKFVLRLLPEEMEILNESCERYGLSKSECIRNLLLFNKVNGRLWILDKENAKKILFEVNRITNNLNQIIYNTSNNLMESNPELNMLGKDINEVTRLIGRLPFLDETSQGEWGYQISEFINNEIENNQVR